MNTHTTVLRRRLLVIFLLINFGIFPAVSLTLAAEAEPDKTDIKQPTIPIEDDLDEETQTEDKQEEKDDVEIPELPSSTNDDVKALSPPTNVELKTAAQNQQAQSGGPVTQALAEQWKKGLAQTLKIVSDLEKGYKTRIANETKAFNQFMAQMEEEKDKASAKIGRDKAIAERDLSFFADYLNDQTKAEGRDYLTNAANLMATGMDTILTNYRNAWTSRMNALKGNSTAIAAYKQALQAFYDANAKSMDPKKVSTAELSRLMALAKPALPNLNPVPARPSRGLLKASIKQLAGQKSKLIQAIRNRIKAANAGQKLVNKFRNEVQIAKIKHDMAARDLKNAKDQLRLAKLTGTGVEEAKGRVATMEVNLKMALTELNKQNNRLARLEKFLSPPKAVSASSPSKKTSEPPVNKPHLRPIIKRIWN